MRLSATLGFITNSSSAIHHFPREVLDHPTVQHFLKTFEIEGGFVSDNLWHRGECTTVAITQEQKAEVRRQLVENEYDARAPAIDVESDEVVVIYGDEYTSIASQFADLCCQALAEVHGGDPWKYRNADDYN